MVLRQSIKLIVAGYVFWGAVEAILIVLSAVFPQFALVTLPLLAIPIGYQIWLAFRHVRRRATALTVQGDRISFETGLLSKSSRVMELVKIQDVRVDQTFAQRLLNVGDLSLETAGETSRLTMTAVDNPRAAADHILTLSRAQRTGMR
jgi:membrane protein YdbS with pleckstrin-like domain